VDSTPNFFFTDRVRAFFSLHAILTYVVRASRRPGQVAASCLPTQVFAPVAAQPRPRSSPSSFASVRLPSVLLRGKVPAREGPSPFPRCGRVCRPDVAAYGGHARQLEGGRARQGGRTGVEKSRGVGAWGTESDVEGQNCRCKVVGRFAYMQSLNLYLQS